MFEFISRLYFIITGAYIKPFGAFYAPPTWKFFHEYKSEKNAITCLKYLRIFYKLDYRDKISKVILEDNSIKVILDKYNFGSFGTSQYTKRIIRFPFSLNYISNHDLFFTDEAGLLTIYIFDDATENYSGKTLKELMLGPDTQ